MRLRKIPVNNSWGSWGFLLTVALAIVTGTLRTDAHVGDVVYPFTEITDDMLEVLDLTDGWVEDWEDLVGEPTLTLLDFTADTRVYDTPERDPGNLDFRIWLGWHRGTGRVYMGAQVIDDVYVGGFGGEGDDTARYDAIEIGIDGDHSGGVYWRRFSSEREWNQQAQPYRAVAEASEGPYLDLVGTSDPMSGLADWMVKFPYAEVGGTSQGETPTVYIVELAITPFDLMLWDDRDASMTSDLSAGRVVGFNLGIIDVDSRPGQTDGYYALFLTPEGAPDADFFGDGILLPSDNDTEGSVVESVSWARIKASLEIIPTPSGW